MIQSSIVQVPGLCLGCALTYFALIAKSLGTRLILVVTKLLAAFTVFLHGNMMIDLRPELLITLRKERKPVREDVKLSCVRLPGEVK